MTARLPDPVVDTPMIVTLDELRAYEYDPRVGRNPLYDEIRRLTSRNDGTNVASEGSGPLEGLLRLQSVVLFDRCSPA